MNKKKKISTEISLDSYIELKVMATKKQEKFTVFLADILESYVNKRKTKEDNKKESDNS